MKQIFLTGFSFFILLIAVVALVASWAVHAYSQAGPLEETKYIHIEQGKGVGTIAYILQQENVIRYPLLFKVASRFHPSLKAGEYEFTSAMPMAAILVKMATGDTFDRKVTIPEGYTSHQIVKLLMARDDMIGDITSIPMEGTLLPDTYHYVMQEDRNQALGRMQAAMTKTLDELWEKRATDLPIQTKQEALILASIVEKETGVAAERERIAGVFINRLKQNIPLQTDPTVIYALTKGDVKDDGMGPLGRRLLTKDLVIDSPYNTYKYAGLPPGPICNPGAAALAATLNPEKHTYIFFVADGTGGHVFAETLAEHNKNVAQWRKIRQQ